MDLFGIGMFPPPPFNNEAPSKENSLKYNNDDVCGIDLMGFLMGFDRDQCNNTMMSWESYSTSSVRTIVQYAQEINSGIFKNILSFNILCLKANVSIFVEVKYCNV